MDILRVALALFIVFGLLGGLYFLSNRAKRVSWPSGLGPISLSSLVKKQNQGQASVSDDEVRVLKRLHLTANHQLHFVAVNDSRILLCTHPQGCQVLPIPQGGHRDLTEQANEASGEGEHHVE